MSPLDPVLFRELPVIRKIIDDETWLEGERRGCFVPPDDCVVREKVCEIVLRIGQQMREAITAALQTPTPIPVSGRDGEMAPRTTAMPESSKDGEADRSAAA